MTQNAPQQATRKRRRPSSNITVVLVGITSLGIWAVKMEGSALVKLQMESFDLGFAAIQETVNYAANYSTGYTRADATLLFDQMRQSVEESVHNWMPDTTTADANTSKPHESKKEYDHQVTPLEDLTRPEEADEIECPNGMVAVKDTILPRHITHPPGRLIPRVVHVTYKSRCVTTETEEHLRQWRFPDHSFYFHDDVAVDALMNETWVDEVFRTGKYHPKETSQCSWEHGFPPNVPPRQVYHKCATAGATKADLWRYALLWRYGGIYTDVDNSPTGFNGTTIQDDDDSFFVLEGSGIIAQYFLTSSPRHPYMRHTMDDALDHLRMSDNVMSNEPARWTGPGAIKRGFCFFMEAANITNTGYLKGAGVHEGDQNRSVRVVGVIKDPKRINDYINRGGLGKKNKDKLYAESNITYYLDFGKKFPRKGAISCEKHIRKTTDPYKKANYGFVKGKYIDLDSKI